MTVSLVNVLGINRAHKFDYYNANKIDDGNKTEQLGPNNHNVKSINPNNKFVPIIGKQELDFVEFEGIHLPEGLEFTNINSADKAIYVTKLIDGVTRLIRKADQFGSKIVMNGSTAENGVMVLKRVAKRTIGFRGKNLNPQYNIVSNPMKIYSAPSQEIQGEKLSIVSR
jgi:hypothetical protein